MTKRKFPPKSANVYSRFDDDGYGIVMNDAPAKKAPAKKAPAKTAKKAKK